MPAAHNPTKSVQVRIIPKVKSRERVWVIALVMAVVLWLESFTLIRSKVRSIRADERFRDPPTARQTLCEMRGLLDRATQR